MIELGKLVDEDVLLTPVDKSIKISGISADSRTIEPANIFAALSGSQFDGAQFISIALEKGAGAILTGHKEIIQQTSVPIIRVDDPRLGLAKMAARFFSNQPANLVAVTGTAGKTSVVEFVRQIWTGCGRVAASIGTTGVFAPKIADYGNLTTPDPVTLHHLLDNLYTHKITHAAIEASSHGLDQKRLHAVKLSAAAFTNLGRDHLDYHNNIEEYFIAKTQLFTQLLPKGSPAIIFADDGMSDKIAKIAKNAGHEILQVGRGGDFLSLKRVEHERYKQIAEIVHGNKSYRVKFPLAGDFQISNGLVAAGLAMACGEDFEAVMNQLELLKGASGRLELIGHTPDGAPVYVDYAHKPEALENVLNSLRPFASRNLSLVFGCGGDRDPGKRPIMGEIGQRLADKIIVTDDNPRTEEPDKIRRAILATAPGAVEISDRREAINHAISELGEGDCLVIAGKGHERGQIIGNNILEFSDHEEVQIALEACKP